MPRKRMHSPKNASHSDGNATKLLQGHLITKEEAASCQNEDGLHVSYHLRPPQHPLRKWSKKVRHTGVLPVRLLPTCLHPVQHMCSDEAGSICNYSAALSRYCKQVKRRCRIRYKPASRRTCNGLLEMHKLAQSHTSVTVYDT